MMRFREVLKSELSQIWQINRTEYVEANYRLEHGKLITESVNKTLKGWSPDSKPVYAPALEDCYDRNGFFWGYFSSDEDRDILKAVAVLDPKWLKNREKTLQLKFLHIDRTLRKQGLGRKLFDKIAEHARSMGAKTLYISASETKNTVDFYMHLGCRISRFPDPELLELEPEDIHLEFKL